MDDPVRTALDDAFPDREIEGLVGVGPSWNGGNETVGVDFADGARAYLKTAIEGDGSRIARERSVLAHVAATGRIRVPRIISADPDASVPYLATAPAPGRSLLDAVEAAADDEEHVSLLRGVGRTLATLHEDTFDTHGEIAGSEEASGLRLATGRWTEVLLATIERTREISTTDRLASHFDAVIDCVESNRDRLDGAPAALLHGDIAEPNGFVVDGADHDTGAVRGRSPGDSPSDPPPIGLLDWELAHVGDPARDLVRARDQLCNDFDSDGPERLREAVCEGYRERAGGLPAGFAAREPVYRVVRVLGRSGFIDQWGTYLDTPTSELVTRIDAELDRRLAAV